MSVIDMSGHDLTFKNCNLNGVYDLSGFVVYGDNTNLTSVTFPENPTTSRIMKKANARCYSCGAPMLTDGRYFECEYCGGGITEKS